MSRSWPLFLDDMCEAARKVIRYVGDRDREAFFRDELIYDATVRNLFLIGEAAKGIPEWVRQQYPEIDWRGVTGLRDLLAHAYFGINEAILWEIIRERVPRLLGKLEQIDAASLGPEVDTD